MTIRGMGRFLQKSYAKELYPYFEFFRKEIYTFFSDGEIRTLIRIIC